MTAAGDQSRLLGFEQFRAAVWHHLPDCLRAADLAPAIVMATERALGRAVRRRDPRDPLWANAAIDIVGWALACYARGKGLPMSDATIRSMLPPKGFARLTPILRSRIVRAAEAEGEGQ